MNFPTGLVLSGEEGGPTASGSVVSAFDKSGARTALPHLGAFKHENQFAVPGFGREVVSIGLDDGSGKSEVYRSVADDEAAFLAGAGTLLVFRTLEKSAAGNALHSADSIAHPGRMPAALAELCRERYSRFMRYLATGRAIRVTDPWLYRAPLPG